MSLNVVDVAEMRFEVFIVGKNEFESFDCLHQNLERLCCNHPLELLLFSQLRVSQGVGR